MRNKTNVQHRTCTWEWESRIRPKAGEDSEEMYKSIPKRGENLNNAKSGGNRTENNFLEERCKMSLNNSLKDCVEKNGNRTEYVFK